jgi:hypothetical protein
VARFFLATRRMGTDLMRFDADHAAALTDAACAAAAHAATREAGARALCRRLYDELVGPAGERACVMVRCYATHAYGALPADLQRFAKRAYGAVAITPPEPEMRCLVLLATVGDEPEWNDRRASRGHQAIPLPSPHVVERAPMIAQLVRELGLDLARVVRPVPGVLRGAGADLAGVFHVERAAGSPYIPAQADFVARHGVRSVLGFGGALPSGELFAVILFSRVPISGAVADGFSPLASAVLRAVADGPAAVFDGGAGD